MTVPVIETARLRLRAFREADFEPIFAGLQEPAVTAFLGSLSREEHWGKLLRNMGQWLVDGYGVFTVADRASDIAIGQCGLADFRRGIGPRFDGVPEQAWVFSSSRGRGLATEAARASLDWLAGVRGPERTVCLIDPDNAPSLRVAAKLDYAVFGTVQYKGRPALMLERAAD